MIAPTTTGPGASPDPDEILTAAGVSALLKIPRKTVYEYRKQGRLRGGYLFGDTRCLRFRRGDVLEDAGFLPGPPYAEAPG